MLKVGVHKKGEFLLSVDLSNRLGPKSSIVCSSRLGNVCNTRIHANIRTDRDSPDRFISNIAFSAPDNLVYS